LKIGETKRKEEYVIEREEKKVFGRLKKNGFAVERVKSGDSSSTCMYGRIM
jgi:hypothetical protein